MAFACTAGESEQPDVFLSLSQVSSYWELSEGNQTCGGKGSNIHGDFHQSVTTGIKERLNESRHILFNEKAVFQSMSQKL